MQPGPGLEPLYENQQPIVCPERYMPMCAGSTTEAGVSEGKKPNEFRMGLALAGAISAGAYTAGVIDFLVQALEEWEKTRGEPSVPQHRAGLKVITGASAGAITGA